MSRPDDAITNAGHPTGWPRQHDAVARDPVTGRPLPPMPAPTPADAWPGGAQAAPAYHYPGQDQGQFYSPGGTQPASAPQHYQPQGQPAPRTQPGGRAPAAGAAGGDYAPQFARYSGSPDVQPPIPQAYAADAYQPPAGQFSYPQGAAAQQPGVDPHWQGGAGHFQNGADPRGYDTQHYAPAGHGLDNGQHGHYAQQPQGYADPNAGYAQQGYQPGYQDAAYQQGQYAPPDQGYDPRTGQPYAPAGGYDQGYGQNGAALDPGQPISGAEGGYDSDYGVEPPPRKRRGLLVAGALVCAVAVGGGLAFVYKTFGQSGKRIGPPPVVAKASAPSKVAPSDPQGKQFDNANKKVLARLDEPAGSATTSGGAPTPMVPGMVVSMPPSAPQPPAAAPDGSGSPSTRTVQTVQIGRDGNPVGSQQQAVSPRGLPGVQIDNSLNPPTMRGGLPPADAQQPAAAPPAAKPQQRLAAALPPSAPPADAVTDAADPAAAPKAKPRAVLAKVAKAPATTGATTPAAAPASGGGAGYVAVLSSQKDRAAALRIFADLAQKYPGQLGGRQPEVQEANLGDKGVWQRLVVGPPSSQQAAKELCTQLKAAGHGGDCWAKQY